MLRLALLLLVIIVLLVGCGAGPYAISRAELRDTVFGVEPRQNGAWVVWFTHDDVGTYCTLDRSLGEKARTIMRSEDPEVIAVYRSINVNDPEFDGNLFDIDLRGCPAEAGEAHDVYLLIELRRVGE